MLARLVTDQRPSGSRDRRRERLASGFRVAHSPPINPPGAAEARRRTIRCAAGGGRPRCPARARFSVVGAAGIRGGDVIATLAARCHERSPSCLATATSLRCPRSRRVGALSADRRLSSRWSTRPRSRDATAFRGAPTAIFAPARRFLPTGFPGEGHRREDGGETARRASVARRDPGRDHPPAAVARRLEAGRDYLRPARRVVLPVPTYPCQRCRWLAGAARRSARLQDLVAAHGLATPVERVQQACIAAH